MSAGTKSWRSFAVRHWTSLAVSLGTACAFNDSNQDIEQNLSKIEERQTPKAVQAGARSVTFAPKVTDAAAPHTFTRAEGVQSGVGGQASDSGASQGASYLLASPGVPRCPENMREVNGSYCTDLMHRCVKGGRTHTEEETEEPEPYYCEAYQPGFAKCLEKEEPKHFCIDEFEYPNRAGAIPVVMVTWFEAKRLCEVQSKRLCGDDEWTLACEGPERLPYPYGWARDTTACNIGHLWVQPNDGILGKPHRPSVRNSS